MVNFTFLVYFIKNTFIKNKKMAIEIRELVIRASVERKIVPAGSSSLTDDEKRRLKAEVLAHCLKELNRNTISTNNTINR